MKTEIKRDGDTIIVSLEGNLDFETQVPLREDLYRLLRQAKTDSTAKNIIFNMEHLEFVGSSGISAFVQALKDFSNHSPAKPRYCNVRSEFKRIFRAFDQSNEFEFFESEERAKRSFDN